MWLSRSTLFRSLRRSCLLLGMAGTGIFAACAQNTGVGGGPFPAFAEFEGQEIGEVIWAGQPLLPTDSLEAVTVIDPPTCRISFLPRSLCFVPVDKTTLDLLELASDVARLRLYFRDHGYYETRIVPNVEPLGPGEVSVRFAIAPGDRITLAELTVEGEEGILEEERVLRTMPLKVGGPFRRIDDLASRDTFRTQLQRQGYAYTEILRNYSIDTIANVAAVQYLAIAGPLVRVDSIRIVGADRLSRSTIQKQITIREGEILQLPELTSSQRNLHQLSIVNFATIEMAPDSLQIDPDSSTASVLVSVVEAPKYLLNAAAGYATVDCLRAGTRLTDRDFLGGARTLEISASAAKIGVGSPLDFGLDGTVCPGLANDAFSNEMTYRVAADFAQPRLLGTRTSFASSLHAERQSELGLFLRRSIGSQLSISRDLGKGVILATGLEVERGRTQTTQAVFCVIFTACTEDEADPLRQSRWTNSVTLSGTWDRTLLRRNEPFGFQVRASTAWASAAFGSADKYLSALTEVVGYLPLQVGWNLSGRVQVGRFFTGRLGLDEAYIPPERRFYAGGPTTVRGFSPNALGPQAYVTDDESNPEASPVRYPLGGTQVGVASVELTTPSPFLPTFLRFAAFVDAGQVWAPGLDRSDVGYQAGNNPIRITPGLGVRFTTPVGPIRVDVGYNSYDLPSGPLYVALEDSRDRPTGDLLLVDPDYKPPVGTFLDRLEIHVAVGQPF